MCVIIERPPNTIIPIEKLTAACQRNSDGYGILVLDRGKFEIQKRFDPKGNDPEEVAKILEDAKNHIVYVHLRYQTKGPKNEENCHPFQVFKNGDDEIFFMHNGTIHNLGSNTVSDSKEFADEILKPFFERSYKALSGDSDTLLNDSLLSRVLSYYAGSNNKFVLINNLGLCLKINEEDGKKITFDETSPNTSTIWASNEYSFQGGPKTPVRTFPEPWKPAYPMYSGEKLVSTTSERSDSNNGPIPWKDKWVGRPTQNVGNKKDTIIPFVLPNNDSKSGETNTKTQEIAKIERLKTAQIDIPQENRPTFIELFGLTSWEEITKFTKDDFAEFIDEMPEAMVILLCDLRDMLFWKQKIKGVEKDGET